MSNVLIGIIGVILFIGLALAGALFLGPRFQEATLNSRASATVQAVSQIAHAAEMRNISVGTPLTSSSGAIDSLATEGWLKTPPTNPSGGTGIFLQSIDGSTTAGTAHIVVAVLPREAKSKALCEAIARQTSGVMIDGSSTMATDPTGCVRSSGDPLHYAVYATIR
jgi:hypothetical protein